MNKLDILKRADIFYDLTPTQYEMLAAICEEQRARLCDQGLRSAAARCSEAEPLLLKIPRDKLIRLCESYPELGYRIMRNMAADLAFKIRGSDLAIREQLLGRPRPA